MKKIVCILNNKIEKLNNFCFKKWIEKEVRKKKWKSNFVSFAKLEKMIFDELGDMKKIDDPEEKDRKILIFILWINFSVFSWLGWRTSNV